MSDRIHSHPELELKINHSHDRLIISTRFTSTNACGDMRRRAREIFNVILWMTFKATLGCFA